MEVRAVAKYVRVTPRKVRIVADELRGRPAVHASALLRYHPAKSARMLRKVLESAMANAVENNGLSRENLRIATILIDEGPVLKRMRARAMGRGFRIEKKTAHITVVVEDYEPEAKSKKKPKVKARPTFAAPAKKATKKKGAEKVEEEVLQPETTDTAAEEVTAAPPAENEGAAAEPEEATPVTAAEAPEEATEKPDLEHESTAEAEGAGEQQGAE